MLKSESNLLLQANFLLKRNIGKHLRGSTTFQHPVNNAHKTSRNSSPITPQTFCYKPKPIRKLRQILRNPSQTPDGRIVHLAENDLLTILARQTIYYQWFYGLCGELNARNSWHLQNEIAKFVSN